ncbi:hypothetical protein DIPPA_50586, partial [Diplonema papillatum]
MLLLAVASSLLSFVQDTGCHFSNSDAPDSLVNHPVDCKVAGGQNALRGFDIEYCGNGSSNNITLSVDCGSSGPQRVCEQKGKCVQADVAVGDFDLDVACQDTKVLASWKLYHKQSCLDGFVFLEFSCCAGFDTVVQGKTSSCRKKDTGASNSWVGDGPSCELGSFLQSFKWTDTVCQSREYVAFEYACAKDTRTGAPWGGTNLTVAPPSDAPFTNAPTDAPHTFAPLTEAPLTDSPSTAAPPTDAPLTTAPTTAAPPTDAPSTEAPPTRAPLTTAPLTDAPFTNAPPTLAPLTEAPLTDAPPTAAPPTGAPPTHAPLTTAPTTAAPVTDAPPTHAPNTEAPPTAASPTDAPPTDAPLTTAPPTDAPVTDAPPSLVPLTDAPPTDAPL